MPYVLRKYRDANYKVLSKSTIRLSLPFNGTGAHSCFLNSGFGTPLEQFTYLQAASMRLLCAKCMFIAHHCYAFLGSSFRRIPPLPTIIFSFANFNIAHSIRPFVSKSCHTIIASTSSALLIMSRVQPNGPPLFKSEKEWYLSLPRTILMATKLSNW